MFQPRDVAPHRFIDPSAGLARPRNGGLGQRLEKYLIGPAAAINADHENDRTAQQLSDTKRALGERRRRPEEVVPNEVLAVDVPIGKHADEVAAIEAIGDRNEGIQSSQADHFCREARIDRRKGGADLARVFLVHEKADRNIALAPTEGACDLEAAEMRAEQHTTIAALLETVNDFLAVYVDNEFLGLLVDQK